MNKNKKAVSTKLKVICALSWMLLLASSILFVFAVHRFGAIPVRWEFYILIVLAIICFISSIFCFAKWFKSTGKTIFSIINIILSILLVIGSFYLPNVRQRIMNMFASIPTEGRITIQFYALTDEYKNEHGIYTNTSGDSIDDYLNGTFILQSNVDVDNQNYAMDRLAVEKSVQPNTLVADSVWNGIDHLYNGEGDVFVLNAALIPAISELDGYEDFEDHVKLIYEIERIVEINWGSSNTGDFTKEPFLIYVAGSDARDDELSIYSRFDVNIVLAVNPNTHQVIILSTPRDFYLPNPDLGNGLDKLTHMGYTGVDNSAEVLSNLYHQDITNYIVVNFSSFKNIIDAIGGVDIYNPYTFLRRQKPHRGEYFYEGDLHLDGEEALFYVRERYHLPQGDISRNEHQVLVLNAIIKKVTSPEVISHFGDLLNALQGNFISNIDTNQFFNLASSQLDNQSNWEVFQYTVSGYNDMQPCASYGDELLYVFWPNQDDVNLMVDQINRLMKGEILTQQTLSSKR